MRTVAGTRALPKPVRKHVHTKDKSKKWCPKCETWKPRTTDHFTWSKSGWYGYCKLCREPGRPNYERNFEKLRELKDGQRCMDCGHEFRFFQLDYDHRPGVDKVDAVARLCSAGKGWKTILAEIAKCDLICANCHRMRTWLRATGTT